MKFYKRIALSSALLVATLPNVQAAESSIPVEFSGSVALTSDYVFRGVSLSNENMAMQGEFDATHSSGAYIGTWASNVSFDPSKSPNNTGSLELDVYAGYAGKMNDFGYDLFVTRLIYPGSGTDATTNKDHQNLDYHEFSLALSYSLPMGTEVGVRYDYAPIWADTGSKADNYLFTVGHELPMGISVGASLGRQDFREKKGGTDYTYYGVQVAYSINKFTLALDFSDTNLKDPNGNDQEDADGRFFFTLSKEF